MKSERYIYTRCMLVSCTYAPLPSSLSKRRDVMLGKVVISFTNRTVGLLTSVYEDEDKDVNNRNV